jgi:hypothetical protein
MSESDKSQQDTRRNSSRRISQLRPPGPKQRVTQPIQSQLCPLRHQGLEEDRRENVSPLPVPTLLAIPQVDKLFLLHLDRKIVAGFFERLSNFRQI